MGHQPYPNAERAIHQIGRHTRPKPFLRTAPDLTPIRRFLENGIREFNATMDRLNQEQQ